ncbi:TOBE domain-containing protein [Orbaceae bacterium ESL0727]|nr:TOBE domain-containing protein [Orbaceae bacterium ESL0727]
MLNPDILLTLKIKQQLFIDPRRIALLKALSVTASLNQAAKQIGISYKTAWDAINEINKLAPQPLVITATGGKGGGGTRLSAYAVRFLQLYDLLTQLQYHAFSILSDDKVPLDDILTTTAKLSLQTSARNQLYGTITAIQTDGIAGSVTVMLADKQTQLHAFITEASIDRLKLSVDKTVLLLIKAPLIDLNKQITNSQDDHRVTNCLTATVKHKVKSAQWSEFQLQLADNLLLYVSKPNAEINDLDLQIGDNVMLTIHPEHIIVATLV